MVDTLPPGECGDEGLVEGPELALGEVDAPPGLRQRPAVALVRDPVQVVLLAQLAVRLVRGPHIPAASHLSRRAHGLNLRPQDVFVDSTRRLVTSLLIVERGIPVSRLTCANGLRSRSAASSARRWSSVRCLFLSFLIAMSASFLRCGAAGLPRHAGRMPFSACRTNRAGSPVAPVHLLFQSTHLFCPHSGNAKRPSKESVSEELSLLPMKDNNDNVLSRMAETPLFANLSESERTSLAMALNVRVKTCEPAELVVHECDPASEIVCVLAGRLHVYECGSKDDSRHLVHILSPGEVYGASFPVLDLT